jgi:membrane protein
VAGHPHSCRPDLALAVAALASLLLLFSFRAASLPPIVEWPLLAIMLLIAFALLYRFGPNLPDREIRWSTPGAVLAMILWLCVCALFRAYMTFQASEYDQVYGAAGAVAILLLWLYFTGAAILIGGEADSEIENAAAQQGHPDARRPGEHRPGGIAPRRAT